MRAGFSLSSQLCWHPRARTIPARLGASGRVLSRRFHRPELADCAWRVVLRHRRLSASFQTYFFWLRMGTGDPLLPFNSSTVQRQVLDFSGHSRLVATGKILAIAESGNLLRSHSWKGSFQNIRPFCT